MPPNYTAEDVLIFNPHWSQEQADAWLAAYGRMFDLCMVDGPEPEDLERADGDPEQGCIFQAARIAEEVAWRLTDGNKPRALSPKLEAAVVAVLKDYPPTHGEKHHFRTFVPVVALADIDAGDEGLFEGQPIQIAKVGHFPPRDLDITEEMLEKFAQNADPDVFGKQIHFDYDHGSEFESDNPAETGKAAGWLKSLFVEDGALWAIPQWTEAAFNAIKAKEWKYISPAFSTNYVKDDGTELGPALTSIAITNHPFLKGMQQITASETVIDIGEQNMPKITLELSPEVLGLEEDATVEQANERITEVFSEHKTLGERITELTGMFTSVLSKLGFKEDEIDLEAEDAGEQLAEAAGEKVEKLSEKRPAQEPGTVTLSEKRLSELETAAEAGKLAAEKLHVNERDAAVEALLSGRMITPAQEDYARKLYDKDVEMFGEWAETLTPIAALSDGTLGDGGEPDEDESPAAEFNRAVEEKLAEAKEKGITMSHREAFLRVGEDDPELEQRYSEHFRQQ